MIEILTRVSPVEASLIAAVATLVATLAYMIFTGWLTWETRRMRQAQSEPRVSVQLEPDSKHRGYDLVIRNEGQGPAKKVRFKFEGDSSYFRNSWVGNAPPPVDELPAIRDGLAYLATGQVLKYPIGVVTKEEFDRACQHPWMVNVQYQTFAGAKRKETYPLDFSQFKGQIFDSN